MRSAQRKLPILFIFLALFLFSLFIPSPIAAATCSLSSTSVPAGGSVTITGSGFDSNKTYIWTVSWTTPPFTKILEKPVESNSSGYINTSITIPKEWDEGTVATQLFYWDGLAYYSVCNTGLLTITAAAPTPIPGGSPIPGEIPTALGTFKTDPAGFVGDILTIAFGAAGGIAFLLIVFGSIRILTSTGDPEAVNQGREIITSAIVGLLFIIFSVFILRLLGITVFKEFGIF